MRARARQLRPHRAAARPPAGRSAEPGSARNHPLPEADGLEGDLSCNPHRRRARRPPVPAPAEIKALAVAALGVAGSFALAAALVTRTPLGRIL
jgi:hypothetical protein